jgi:hypothetical protein
MQKAAFFSLLFFLVSFSGFSQENKSSLINAKIKDGTIMVGGTLGGSYQKYTQNNNKSGLTTDGDLITARLVGKGGYFFLPDFAVGVNIAIEHTSINIDSTIYGSKNTFLLVGPFVRYYLDNGLFGELNASVGTNVIKGANQTDIKGGAIGIGYAYFLNPTVSIEPLLTLNYLRNRTDNLNFNTTDSQFGPVLNIGIQAYLYSPTRVLPTK